MLIGEERGSFVQCSELKEKLTYKPGNTEIPQNKLQ